MSVLSSYSSLFDNVLINCGFALSQYIVLRAGIFSLATAGFAALGGYAAAIAVQRLHLPPSAGMLIALAMGMLAGGVLAQPLARLRGVFQAIASIAMVQLIQSLLLYAEPITGGAGGLNGIPPAANTYVLLGWLVLVVVLLGMLGRSDIGRTFDTIREDETLAVSLGVNVASYHSLAFVLSGAIAGVGGALIAFHDYSLMPDTFGFTMMTNVLAFVVLGGSGSITGALVGATVLTVLPEVARPFADNRMIASGIILILAITYLPQGLVDGLRLRLRRQAPPVAQVRDRTQEAGDVA